MLNFLETYADPIACRTALEAIAPIKFARMGGQLWTTLGELDRFAVPLTMGESWTKGAGARLIRGQLAGLPGLETKKITDQKEGDFFATQMDMASGRFVSAIKNQGFLWAISPSAALIALLIHRSQNSSRLRASFGIPDVYGSAAIPAFKRAIERQIPDHSWGKSQVTPPVLSLNRADSAILKPSETLSFDAVLSRCAKAEKEAREVFDRAEAAVILAKKQWESAQQDLEVLRRVSGKIN
jgi:HPt (histidine-containing phosphotransfer) domain-containing protein